MTLADGIRQREERLPKGTVIIGGGGPVGLLLATVLSHYGVKSVLLERNTSTTKWPKMDLTNARSMEIFRRLGLAEALRHQGVPAHINQPVLVSSGLGANKPITKWELPGVDEFRERIKLHNDGTQPLEPWQRLSQAIFEKWLKALCDKDPLIDVRFGWKVETVEEGDDRVRTLATNIDTGETALFVSDYMAGCDGASSRTRKSLEIPLDGGPIPSYVLLVHFKSRDLTRLHKQGLFWHIFFLGEPGGFGGAVIAQDEVETWTIHLFLPLGVDPTHIPSEEAVYRVLGGLNGKYEIQIDEILVRSVWRPNIAVARSWTGPNCRVFVAGDAAHQNIPTGGYGMNMGIGDAYDLGWKLVAVIQGYAGRGLLESYELERRPVALRNVERSGVHFQVHAQLKDLLAGIDPQTLESDSQDARAVRARIHEHYQKHDGENKDFGIEMGYRYESPVVIIDPLDKEPEWSPSYYTPTSWPGGRPPHIFLSDGTPIFDKLGRAWTLLSFSEDDRGQKFMTDAAELLSVPLIQVDLRSEKLAEKLYERALVLIRPDEHVAWRSNRIKSAAEAVQVLTTVTGRRSTDTNIHTHVTSDLRPTEAFAATTLMTTQVGSFDMERMG